MQSPKENLKLNRTLGLIAACGLAAAAPVIAQTGFVHWETPHTSPIALTPSGNKLLAVNTADNRLEVFDLVYGSPIYSMSISVGLDPVSVRARTDSEVWVVNQISDSISVIDLPTGRVVRTILTGDEPADVVFAGTPQRAFVSISQFNQVRVYDPANLAAAPTILPITGEHPRALTVSPDGSRVFAAIFESGNATGVVRQQDVSNTAGPYGGVNPPPNAGNAFDPPQAAGNAPPPPVAQIVRRTAAGTWLDDNQRNWSQFVTWNVLDRDVAIIDSSTLATTYATGLMTTVMALGCKPDGTLTAVGTEATNEVRFEPNVNGVFIRVRMGSFNPATPASKTITDLNPHLTYAVRSIPAAQREESIGDPRAIVWHPTSGLGYVAGLGSNNVIVIDGNGARVGRINVGQGPSGLALGPDGSRLYVMNKFGASISVIDTASNTELSRLRFFDPTPGQVKAGRPFLYDTHRTSGLGQASCASCHIDARSDFLAWDLGNPAGAMKANNQPCQTPTCGPWHPMKGPMVTQSLQAIVGNGAMHWRGDREDLAAFAPAYTGLQAADAAPNATELQQFTDFVATIRYQPNPNRGIDNSMPASFPVTGGTGNPNNGLNIFRTAPVLPGGATCVSCHGLPTGTNGRIDNPPLPLAPQPLKIAQLRGLWEKNGWRRNSQTNTMSFGFNHHSEFDTLQALLQAGFNFGPAGTAVQARADVEAFMLCFDSGTHGGMGQQVTFDGSNNNDAAALGRLNSFVNSAATSQVGLVAKRLVGGVERGYVLINASQMQADRVGEVVFISDLRTSAAPGSEVTFTVVPIGTQVRIGIDRDADGFFDGDELAAGSDPSDPQSIPSNAPCNVADIVSVGGLPPSDGAITGDDFVAFINAFGAGNRLADIVSIGGEKRPDNLVTGDDFVAFINAFSEGCP